MENNFIGRPIEDVLSAKVQTIDCFVSGHPQSGVTILELVKIILEDGREFRFQGHYYGAYLPIEGDRMNQSVLIELAKQNEKEDDLREMLENQ